MQNEPLPRRLTPRDVEGECPARGIKLLLRIIDNFAIGAESAVQRTTKRGQNISRPITGQIIQHFRTRRLVLKRERVRLKLHS